MRVMIRMCTATYGESVSCTPTCAIGEPSGPIEIRHHVHRAALHRAAEELAELLAHLGRVAPVVGRARVRLLLGADERAVLDAGHVVRVGAGQERVRPTSSSSLSNTPASTISSQSWSYSSCDPSHQWIESGCVSSATSSTHALSLAWDVGASAATELSICGQSAPLGSLGKAVHCAVPVRFPPSVSLFWRKSREILREAAAAGRGPGAAAVSSRRACRLGRRQTNRNWLRRVRPVRAPPIPGDRRRAAVPPFFGRPQPAAANRGGSRPLVGAVEAQHVDAAREVERVDDRPGRIGRGEHHRPRLALGRRPVAHLAYAGGVASRRGSACPPRTSRSPPGRRARRSSAPSRGPSPAPSRDPRPGSRARSGEHVEQHQLARAARVRLSVMPHVWKLPAPRTSAGCSPPRRSPRSCRCRRRGMSCRPRLEVALRRLLLWKRRLSWWIRSIGVSPLPPIPKTGSGPGSRAGQSSRCSRPCA